MACAGKNVVSRTGQWQGPQTRDLPHPAYLSPRVRAREGRDDSRIIRLKGSPRGVRRWTAIHGFTVATSRAAGLTGGRGARPRSARKPLGVALWSPASEISLRHGGPGPKRRARPRLVATPASAPPAAARATPSRIANAIRIVHGEADGCPSLFAIGTTRGSSCSS